MPTTAQRLKFGDFEFDQQSGELWRNGDRVVLPNQPFRILAFLILGALAAYLAWVWRKPREIGRDNWQVTLPGGPLTLRGSARWCTGSGWRSVSTTSRRSCPAGSSSGSPWRGLW